MGESAKEIHEEYLEANAYYEEVMEKQRRGESVSAIEINLAMSDVDKTKLIRGVLHELKMNKLAAERYKSVFSEDLPIEHPLGIVVSREGRKWVIYDKLNELDQGHLTPGQRIGIAKRKDRFTQVTTSRLKQIGINPSDFNAVAVGNPNNLASVGFVVVDSERWYEIKK